MVSDTIIVQTTELGRSYRDGSATIHALSNVDLVVRAGEFVSLAGPSGSGKSTLLNCIGGLDQPTSGSVSVGGVSLGELNSAELADLRLSRIGFVFQSFNLIPVLSAIENVEFIMQLQGVDAIERHSRAGKMLDALGIGELAARRPGELSGGQQQRVAVARAIVSQPLLLLADEPSANLDSASTTDLLNLLQQINTEQGMTIITATHDPAVMAFSRRRIQLQDGQIASDDSASSH